MPKQIAAISCTFMGTVIGAGFASGREIALYFSHSSPFTPLLAGVCLGVLCYFFLELGRLYNGDFFVLFGKSRKIFLSVTKLCNIVVGCAMIAASEEVIYSLLSIRGGGVITAALSVITLLCGTEKIKLLNVLIMPAVIIMVGVLFFRSNTSFEFTKLSIIPAFAYASMNIVTGGYFVSTLSGNSAKSGNVKAAVIVGVILSALLVCVYLIIQNTLTETMPLMSAAVLYNMGTAGNIVMYLAVFSSVVNSVAAVSCGKKTTAIFITAVILALSLLSFRKIVDIAYPIMGVIGLILVIITAALLFKKEKQTPNKELKPL